MTSTNYHKCRNRKYVFLQKTTSPCPTAKMRKLTASTYRKSRATGGKRRLGRPEKSIVGAHPRRRSIEGVLAHRGPTRPRQKSGFLDTPLKWLEGIPKYIVSSSDTYSTNQIAIARKSAELPSANCRIHSHGATNDRTSLASDIHLEGATGSYEHYIKSRRTNDRLLGKGWHDDEEGPSAVCCPISSVCSSHGRHRSFREHPD